MMIGTLDNLAGGLIHGAQMGLSNSGTIGSLNNAGTIDPRRGAFAILSTGSIGPITNTGQIIGNVEIDNQAMVTVVGGRGNTFGEWTGGAITIGGGDLTFARGNTALGDNIVVTGADGGPGTVFNNASADDRRAPNDHGQFRPVDDRRARLRARRRHGWTIWRASRHGVRDPRWRPRARAYERLRA